MTKYAPIPAFGQLTEYITQGDLVDGVYQVVINHVDLSNIEVVPAAESLKQDYEKIDALKRLPKLTTKEVESVGTQVKAVYHDDVVKEVIKTDNPITLTGTIVTVKSFPEWRKGIAVKVGEVYAMPEDKNLWKVVQAHTTQSDWTPSKTPALWVKYFTSGDPQLAYWQEWYPYKVGDEVIYQPNGLKYKCLQAHTSQPTWTPPAVPALWAKV